MRKKLRKDGKSTAEVDSQLQEIVRERYRLTKTDTEKYVKDKAGYIRDGFNSQFAQVLADRVWEAVLKVPYGEARRVRFKGKYDNLLASVHAKSTETVFFSLIQTRRPSPTGQRDVLSAYLGLHCNPNPGEWESAADRENHEADRRLLTASHWIYKEQAASRQGFGFALLLDKGSRSCSCGKEERHPSEGHRGLIVRKDLKSLVEQLGPGRN